MSLVPVHDRANPLSPRAHEALVESIEEVLPIRERVRLDTGWIDEIVSD